MPERVLVGRVGRPHGFEGAFAVEGASEKAERFTTGVTIFVAGEAATIVESKRAGGRPVIRLDRRVERGARLEVPVETLGPPDPGSYYVFQLVGLEVEEEGGRVLGRVVDVAAGVANDVLELDNGLALPLVAACVRTVDVDGGRIVVSRGFAADEPR